MPVPEKHADEPTQEIQEQAFAAWLNAKASAEAWKAEELRLRGILEAALGNAAAGTINGRKVLTNRPTDRVAWKRLQEDYPDLTKHYWRDVVVNEFDATTFLRTHRDIAEQYRVRSFRAVADTVEVETSDQGS